MAEECLEVYFLDVGQGDCSFILPPAPARGGRMAVMFDCYDDYVAERFVVDRNIERLRVVASHLDVDHIAGLLPFLKKMQEKGVRLEQLHIGTDRRVDDLKKTARELLRQAIEWDRTRAVDVLPPFRSGPDCVVLGDAAADWEIRIVLPRWAPRLDMELGDREEPNACSAVLRVRHGSSVLLIGGDAPLVSWQDLDPELR